jgi:acetolactate synthase-1/2/3 large subunit
MQIADYLVDFLIKCKVTDVFGIPGGVVLDFLYALDRRKDKINVHLNYHEQCSIFSAAGYARGSKALGVAYATRGPGITNMVTGVADAFCDSIPLLIITGHSSDPPSNGSRVLADQEIDTVGMFAGITKYSARIDFEKDFIYELEKAYFEAMNGRRGPVLLDINSKIFTSDIELDRIYNIEQYNIEKVNYSLINQITNVIIHELKKSSRPIFFVGDGFRDSSSVNILISISERFNIPILSSRFSQDLFSKSKNYFGYVGSHGLRHGNFILSKCNLIIALGNRMIFPIDSKSYSNVLSNAKIIRIDIDSSELKRKIPGSIDFVADVDKVLAVLTQANLTYPEDINWLQLCSTLKNRLISQDYGFPITAIVEILKTITTDVTIVSDVGNNEFWLCRAYSYLGISNPSLYSKSFGAMGSSISKAIGVHYGTQKPVICFVGDQALQMNIQELQFFSDHNLPITIILLNNFSSGMIRSRELKRFGKYFLHTTLETGYSVPNFCDIVKAYGIDSYSFNQEDFLAISKILLLNKSFPKFIEIKIDPTIEMIPHIPKDNLLQNMHPYIDDITYNYLNQL